MVMYFSSEVTTLAFSSGETCVSLLIILYIYMHGYALTCNQLQPNHNRFVELKTAL